MTSMFRIVLIVLAFEFATGSEAERVVSEFHDLLISSMKSEGSFNERYTVLDEAVGKAFDVATITRISLGKSWRDQSAEEQHAFSTLLRELIVTTYASRFSSFNDQRFETTETTEVRDDRWVVKTHLVKSDGGVVRLDYYFRNNLIFDVVADGVSDLSLRRADYASIIAWGGLDGLRHSIQDSIEEYRSSDAP